MKILKNLYMENESFLKDNFFLFAGVFSLGVFGYIFHFFVGRILGPANYGILGSLLSVIYIMAVLTYVVQTTIAKFSATYFLNKEYSKLSYLFKDSSKRTFIIGFIIYLIFIALSPFFKDFLHVPSYTPILIVGTFIIFALMLPVGRGLMQGTQRFKSLGINNGFEGLVKLAFGILLVFLLKFNVSGAIAAFPLSYLFAFLIASYQIKDILKHNHEKFSTGSIYKYSFPVFLTLMGLTLMYSLDVVLIKHFMTSEDAGFYTALSLLGKIIFFATQPISFVMFPKIAASDGKSVLNKSLLLIALIGIPVILFYFLFPRVTIRMLYGPEFLPMKNLVGFFAVIMTFFSLSYALSFYNLALNKKKFIFPVIIILIAELILISLFHDSLAQVTFIMLGIMFALFLSLLIPIEVSKHA